MRASILLWSTASGLILGLFIDATLIGVALLLSTLASSITGRLHQRWVTVVAAAVLTAIPLLLAVLGYLEGRLKTV
jgi:hypothetical protein